MKSIPHRDIYQHHANEYDLLRSRMDYENNILKQLVNLAPVEGADIVELAAGTGRITRMLAPLARSLKSFDRSEHMVAFARKKSAGIGRCQLEVADNLKIPLPDHVADIVMEFGIYGCNSWRKMETHN